MRNRGTSFWMVLACLLMLPLSARARQVKAKPLPKGAYAKNVEFIGFSNVNGHIPFRESIQEAKNGHWYLYLGSQNDRGWSILDVTNPAHPVDVNWIPGPKNTRTGEMEIANGLMITALERSQFGGDTNPKAPWDDGVLIWSLADPVHPKLLGQWRTGGGLGTHDDGYYGGRYVHLAAGMRGYAGNIYVVIDISNPAHPVEVSHWALPGQALPDPNAQNTAYPHGAGLHGPPVPVGHLVYLPYGKKFVILDISDIKHPKEVSEITFDPPFHLLFAVHSVVPFLGRKIVETNSEGGCNEGAGQVSLIDVSNPAKPHILSFFPTPVPPPGAPYKDFCHKGGTFGTHNPNMLFHNPYVDHSNNILYMAWVNAGMRVFDISDAHLPREIGYFIPPDPPYTGKGRRRYTDVTDVVVDTRGYIYASDRSQGIWILRYTGPKPGPAIPVH